MTVKQPVTIFFYSRGAEDGYILESYKGSGTGGTRSSSGLLIGDDKMGRQYKSIVSFETSAIPDDAVILSANLKLRRQAKSVGSVFTLLGPCYTDIAKGSFGNPALETGDFNAPATASKVATLSKPGTNGSFSAKSLDENGLNAIHKGGLTQMRIYFSKPGSNNYVSDYVRFYSGEDPLPENRPVLEVTCLP